MNFNTACNHFTRSLAFVLSLFSNFKEAFFSKSCRKTQYYGAVPIDKTFRPAIYTDFPDLPAKRANSLRVSEVNECFAKRKKETERKRGTERQLYPPLSSNTIIPVPHAGPTFAVPTLGVPWSFFFFVSSVGRLRVCNPAIYRGPHATLILGLQNASWRNRTEPNGQV